MIDKNGKITINYNGKIYYSITDPEMGNYRDSVAIFATMTANEIDEYGPIIYKARWDVIEGQKDFRFCADWDNPKEIVIK